jgi:WD40 repeat protein
MTSQHVRAWLVVAACGLTTASAQERSKNLRKPPERLLNIRALAFSADGRYLASCCGEPEDEGEVVVWDARTHEARWSHKINRGMPTVAFTPDATLLAVGSFTEKCFLFDVETGKPRATLPGHGESARSVAFSPDGKTLAVGSYDQTIRLWDWQSGKVLRTLTGQGDKVYTLAYLPGGKALVSGGPSGSACVWDAASGKLLHRQEKGAMPVAFDPQGQWLATSGNDASVSIRSLKDYETVLARYENIYAYWWLVIHPSGKAFAAHSGMDYDARVFALDLRQATPAEEKRVRDMMALWDDESFAVREKASLGLVKMGNVTRPLLGKAAKEATSAEVRIRAREVLRVLGSPKPLAELRGHDENVQCAAFSLDGKILATGGRDGSALLWDVATYKRSAALNWPKHSPPLKDPEKISP